MPDRVHFHVRFLPQEVLFFPAMKPVDQKKEDEAAADAESSAPSTS